MTNENSSDPQSQDPARPGGRRRRPATLELEATEVASEPGPPASDPANEPPQPPGDDAASSAPGSPPQPETTQATRRGSVALILAGLAGAALALLVMLGLWAFGALPDRFAETDAPALAAKIATLELQVRDLSARPAALDQRRAQEVEARLKGLESGAAAPRPLQSDPAVLEKLAELDRRAEQALAAASEAKTSADVAARETQKLDAKAPANPLDRSDLDAVSARLAGLEQQGKAEEQRRADAASGTDRTVRLALVAMELRIAVERGAPFTTELAAAKRLVGDPASLAPLDAVAETGVPTVAALGQNLSKLAPAMLKAAGNAPPQGGVLDRLQASAARLVRVRPIEEAAGDEPSAAIARAELEASRGDIPGALADLDKLPDAARAPAADWIKAAKSRLAAVDAVKKLATIALDALAKPGG
jgi:hypothetical protein